MNQVATTHAKPALQSGAAMQPIVPRTMEEAYRLGDAICQSGLAPKDMQTPQACMVAIMHGMEIGIPPMQALQRIAVINGRPTLWGDAAMALVRGSGKAKSIKETIEGEGDDRVAVCRVLRMDDPDSPIEGRFAVKDAKIAQLWGKKGPWQQYPERMLKMRARAFALRDGFADVLGGMYLSEELQGAENGSSAQQVSTPPPAIPNIPSATTVDVEANPPAETQDAAIQQSTQPDIPSAQATTQEQAEMPLENKPDGRRREVYDQRETDSAPIIEIDAYAGTVEDLRSRLVNAPDKELLGEVWDEVLAVRKALLEPDQQELNNAYNERMGAFEE